MILKSNTLYEYHVFLASPGDMKAERQAVRQFFNEYNRTTASPRGLQFTVIDWEYYSTAGVGRPQKLITEATLEKYKDSLAVVIGLMGQRFGSPTGIHESGTEEEFEWAIAHYFETGFPEIKWFFRKIENFVYQGSDPAKIVEAANQLAKVQDFQKRLQEQNKESKYPPLFYKEFSDLNNFKDILRQDLSLWLNSNDRPWAHFQRHPVDELEPEDDHRIKYFENIESDFQWLDITGIDTDRAFRIPLQEMYVRLRVIIDEDSSEKTAQKLKNLGAFDIKTALEKLHHLVIVGDPGSGKSTFLKYISLMIARAELENNQNLATDLLSLEPPFPIPVFISLWNLADFLARKKSNPTFKSIIEYMVFHFAAMDCKTSVKQVEKKLENGFYCLLFDGLDEVPTEQGRNVVSRLVEEFVEKYSQNRFVITSRIRAYTGDTILKGEFVRCDIQEFTREDRVEFLKNWFALLFRIPRTDVTAAGSESKQELDMLLKAIERSSRISELAVNPLLLTVVAIVHWNRKRLPEQRVELYDECVDVLLGQRKLAEWAQSIKNVDVFDEQKEENVSENRIWTRKRFSEIALEILCSKDEDITKDKIITLLKPRFIDQGAKNNEEAENKAQQFLERQELRSGLLVSRRSHSYRFVHLTFQEYLAAWNLANQDLKTALEKIKLHIREPKWFETLQLLGCEWANRSDKFLDQYIEFLLGQQGEQIKDRAPIIALCANILDDVTNTADIEKTTRDFYNTSLEDTLNVFDRRSKVPENTQLEILEALGELGSAVKNHLIKATNSPGEKVRARAIEMLAPFLPDDDLFAMQNILHDDSQITIDAYFPHLVEKDVERTRKLLVVKDNLNNRVKQAILNYTPGLCDLFDVSDYLKISNYANSEDNCKLFARNKKMIFRDRKTGDSTSPYEMKTINKDKVVIDNITGLMWQQGGSNEYMSYANAEDWIRELNRTKYAGFTDWRLPTLFEGLSLMEQERKNEDLYIDPVFDGTQSWIWTGDLYKRERGAWVVSFSYGYCDGSFYLYYSSYVRAVRS